MGKKNEDCVKLTFCKFFLFTMMNHSHNSILENEEESAVVSYFWNIEYVCQQSSRSTFLPPTYRRFHKIN